mgnify:CR=1 FL=1
MEYLEGTRLAGGLQVLLVQLLTEGLVEFLEDARQAGVFLELWTRLSTEFVVKHLGVSWGGAVYH